MRAGIASLELSGEQTVVVLNGDVPLITPETIAKLVTAHEHSGAAATVATITLEDPSGYGRIIRAPDGSVERVAETKAPGDASDLELHVREINTGMFAFESAALVAALQEVRPDNAQGEHYLPDVLPIMRAHERSVQAYELSDEREILQINDRRQLGDVTAVAQRLIHERHHAGRGDDRQSGRDADRRGRPDRSGHGDRAVHQPARVDGDRRRLHGRAGLDADRRPGR